MAKEKKPKRGSIILEILIVVFFAALLFSLYMPKKLWDQEDWERDMCRNRMSAILSIEQRYRNANEVYTDTLQYAIDFLKADTTFTNLTDSEKDTLLYNNHPDSLFNCPTLGLPYILKLNEDKTGLDIECPNEPGEMTFYLFFSKKIENHGDIKNGIKSWME